MARTASPLPPPAVAASGRAPSNLHRYSESPQPPTVAVAAAAAAAAVSNTTVGAAATNTITTTATSSSTAPLSKRDKRQLAISEKLHGLTAAFADNRDQHYRAQVQACQIDMSLILLADPYANSPLADSSEEIAEMVGGAAVVPPAHQVQQYEGGKAASNGNGVIAGAGAGAAVRTEAHQAEQLAALVGRQYAQFAGEVNDAMEERDVALTMLNNKYENNLDELQQTHRYKILLAEEEHRLLASTIRERLVQALSQKRSRLLRDKEQLDLADSNALLLHPNQFSINDPASPSGQQNNRKTRHTRHRIDPEELSSTAIAQENKRKRKAAFEETETGSPGPLIGGKSTNTATTAAYNNNTTNNMTDTYAGSPYREARAKLVHTQFEAPLYSLDRLFTEKELSMVMNDAHIAATHFLTKLQTQDDDDKNANKNKNNNDKKGDDSATGAANAVVGDAATTAAATQEEGVESGANMDTTSTIASGTLVATTTVDPADHDIPDMAPEMDRAANTSTMTTRGSSYNNNNIMNGNHQQFNSLLNPTGPMAATAAAAAAAALGNTDTTQLPSTTSALLNPNNTVAGNIIFPPTTIHHPIILPANIGSRANAAAPVPPALNPNDVDYDLALMARPGKTNEALNKQLLEQACGPLIAREYAYRAPGDVGSGSGRGTNGVGAPFGGGGIAGQSMTGPGAGAGLSDVTVGAPTGAELGGVPMSVQSSLGGLSEGGGGGGGGLGGGLGGVGGSVAMSRQSSARTVGASGLTNMNLNKTFMRGGGGGGVGMRRTASANASTGAGGTRARIKGH